jgi:outer membrane receptor protein involved in Fe transport
VVFNRELSQELQVYSPKGSALNWLAGAYYYYAEYGADPFNTILGFPLSVPGASGVGATNVRLERSGITQSYSFYGQASYEILPKTTLTAGYRYTWERRTGTGPTIATLSTDPTGGGANPFTFTSNSSIVTSFSAPTWRLSLDHRFSDELMAYVSYNRGFKSGGVDLGTPADPPFAPEKLDAYELGLKSDLFDRRLRLNVAGFFYNYTNIQVVTNGVGVVFTTNAGAAHIYGLDADLAWSVTDNFRLSAGASYVHNRYTAYPNASCTDTTFGPLYLVQLPCSTFGKTAVGKRLQYSPTFTGNLGFTYNRPLGDNKGSLELASNLYYSTEYFPLPENLQRQAPFTKLNASLTWRSQDERYSLRVYGNNLTDAYVGSQLAIIPAVAAYRIPEPPRTVGAEVAMKF